MKKIKICAAAASLSVCLLAGGIGAYFSDADTAVNTIPIGYNEIVPEEEFDLDEGIKTPRAVNTGDVACYVRARITLSDSRAAEEELISYGTEAYDSFDHDYWYDGEDGWLYYYKYIMPGEETMPVITAIEADDALSERYENVTLDVIFESVQSKGYTDAKAAFSDIAVY